MILSYTTKRSIKHFNSLPLRNTVVGGRRSFSNSSSKWWWSSQAKNTTSSNVSDSYINSASNFDIAFAYEPKDREESNGFKPNSKKPSLASQSPTGEDNLFISDVFDGHVAVGVADGVGGWSLAGYDSSAISRELCNFLKQEFEVLPLIDSPKNLLTRAFDRVMNSPSVEVGGTTACLGIFSPDYKLRVANLGDSWCGVFRDFKLIHETNFQTYNFNVPFQLAKIPAQVQREAELQKRKYIKDTPDKADEYTWKLQKNDLVMFATDGVTDNVVTQDIENFLRDNLEDSNYKLMEVSKKFVKEVVKVSKDPNFPSAFAQEISRLTGQEYLGGKQDDITIVLVKIK